MKKEKIDISVVIPVFNEEENIIKLYERIRDVFQATRFHYEIIFIDDGSEDAVGNHQKDTKTNQWALGGKI